jgi:hypothetical protein
MIEACDVVSEKFTAARDEFAAGADQEMTT